MKGLMMGKGSVLIVDDDAIIDLIRVALIAGYGVGRPNLRYTSPGACTVGGPT